MRFTAEQQRLLQRRVLPEQRAKLRWMGRFETLYLPLNLTSLLSRWFPRRVAARRFVVIIMILHRVHTQRYALGPPRTLERAFRYPMQ